MLKNKWTWIIAGIIIIFGSLIYVKVKPKPPEFGSAKVERKNLIQSVEETGAVEAELELKYGFETGGRVIRVDQRVGDIVKANSVIARLLNSAELSALRQAQANVARAEANLNLKLIGPSAEAIRESEASVARAKAGLEQGKARLEQTRVQGDGAVMTAKRTLESADNDLQLIQSIGESKLIANANADLVNTLHSALPTIADTLRESDAILGRDETTANDSFEYLLGSKNTNTLISAQDSYDAAKHALNSLQLVISPLSANVAPSVIDTLSLQTLSALAVARKHLEDTFLLLLHTTTGSSLSQTTLDGMKSDIAAAQTAINTKIAAVTDDRQDVTDTETSVQSKKIALAKAQESYDTAVRQAAADARVFESAVAIEQAGLDQATAANAKLIAAPREADVAHLRAELNHERAALGAASREYDKTILKAAADGTIAKIDVEIGETVTANQSVLRLVSKNLAIKVDISESDISKVRVNQTADITLDAFGDETNFEGKVVAIEPAETEISGVIYYKTTVTFNGTDNSFSFSASERIRLGRTREGRGMRYPAMGGTDAPATTTTQIRPGMTANIKITTDKKENTLVIPERAVLSEDGKQFARVLTSAKKGAFDKREIKTGLRGDEGMVEILEGLNAGEEVITFLKEI